MSNAGKLLARLTAIPPPKDFTWSEFKTVMRHLGYEEMSGSGSRRRFVHSTTKHLIMIHEPHPDKVLKPYQINDVVKSLRDAGEQI